MGKYRGKPFLHNKNTLTVREGVDPPPTPVTALPTIMFYIFVSSFSQEKINLFKFIFRIEKMFKINIIVNLLHFLHYPSPFHSPGPAFYTGGEYRGFRRYN